MKAKMAAVLLIAWWLFGGATPGWAQEQWIQVKKTDPLTDFSYVSFTLYGEFLQAPSKGGVDKPAFVLECDPTKTKWKGTVRGKLLRAFVVTGAVLNSEVTTKEDLLGDTAHQSLVGVAYRRDDEKNIQYDAWEHSTNFSALFLNYHTPSGFFSNNGDVRLGQLFYWHGIIHKEGKGEQVHKLRISVPEYLGGEVVMQFDLPDLTTVADSCGLIEHKR